MHYPATLFQHELRRMSRLVRSDYPSLFTVRSFAVSSRGSREAVNQDRYLTADHFSTPGNRPIGPGQLHGTTHDPGDSLFVVADGQGESQQGCRAAALAIEVIEEYLRYTWMHHQRREQAASRRQILNALRIAFDRADQFIWTEGQERGHHQEMGAAVTAACTYHGSLFLAHAGDTQAYLWRAGRLYRLTHPSSHQATGYQSNQSQVLEMRRQANLNHKTSLVGGHRAGVHVKLRMLDVEPNDYLLLCTKGLPALIRDHFLSSTISANPNPKKICELLAGEAQKMFVHDDLTVIVARFGLAHE
jgi:PPM family protein phosphatase